MLKWVERKDLWKTKKYTKKTEMNSAKGEVNALVDSSIFWKYKGP